MSDEPRGFRPAIYVDRARCIACNACSLACKQENNFENSAPVEQQRSALADWSQRLRLPMALNDVQGRRLATSESIARREGHPQGVNVVMVRAASRWLPVEEATLRRYIERRFASRGLAMVETNLRLFDAGRQAAAGQQLARGF